MEQDNKKNNLPPDASGTGGQRKVAQTFAEDMANVIENDTSGLVKKIIHGEEEHELEKKNTSPESKKNKFFIFTGSFFILVSIGTLAYFLITKEAPTVPVEQQSAPIIFNDKSTYIEVAGLSKDKIVQSVFNAVKATKVKIGGVEGIYPIYNKREIGLREFLALLKSSFVPGGVEFIYDDFLLGVVNTETPDFFMLLKARSASDIFDPMRAWEQKMFFDLSGFFGVGISLETQYLVTKEFQDGIIENKNARILYDEDNNIVMMYIFADNTSVIIANTESAIREIIPRLATSQIKK